MLIRSVKCLKGTERLIITHNHPEKTSIVSNRDELNNS
ncbi:unnamed protein product [Spirodela intermedia]|uniref:Uncharacterized protein n=1 Tax=Spirodela intermedia TaxID=51605 RepID=A0A7I8LBE5_SPIIN|nr:unnamed protein product [Spirodela intermedia]